MFAAVDLGSNSFRLHVGMHDGETMRIIKTARDPIRLAAGLDGKGCLTETAMQTALESLTRFKTLLAGYPLTAVKVVATNTLRIAKNDVAARSDTHAAHRLTHPFRIMVERNKAHVFGL